MMQLAEGVQSTHDAVQHLYAELEQTNREVLALTLELEQRRSWPLPAAWLAPAAARLPANDCRRTAEG